MNFYRLGQEAALLKFAGGGTYTSFFTGEKRRDATFFPPGTMKGTTKEIVEVAKDPAYAPKGLRSAINWLSYYTNRAGKNLDPKQKARIDKAKAILSKELAKEKKK